MFVLGKICRYIVLKTLKMLTYLILDDDLIMMLSMMERGSCKNLDGIEVYIVD